MRGGRVRRHGMKGDIVGVGEHESRGRGGKFERCDGCVKPKVEDRFVGSQVPPSVVESVLGGDSICNCNCHWTH